MQSLPAMTSINALASAFNFSPSKGVGIFSVLPIGSEGGSGSGVTGVPGMPGAPGVFGVSGVPDDIDATSMGPLKLRVCRPWCFVKVSPVLSFSS